MAVDAPIHVPVEHVKQLSGEQIISFKAQFSRFQDADGTISKRHLVVLLEEQGHDTSKAAVTALINAVEADGQGPFDLHEFLAMMGVLNRHDPHQKIRDAFQVIDTDSDSWICLEEFRALMASIGANFPVEEIDAMFAEVDADSAGYINEDQVFFLFHRWLCFIVLDAFLLSLYL